MSKEEREQRDLEQMPRRKRSSMDDSGSKNDDDDEDDDDEGYIILFDNIQKFPQFSTKCRFLKKKKTL